MPHSDYQPHWGPKPAEMRTGKILQPDAGIGDGSRDMERDISFGLDRLDEGGGRSGGGARRSIIGTIETSPS